MPPQYMIVGLGNPGPQYKGTRHNVGFEVIDKLAEKHKIAVRENRERALIGIGQIDETWVVLVKPMTFMNISGQSVGPLLRKFNLTADRLLVVADDLDMTVGRVRLKPKGSSGGHNGHKSLINSLGTDEYPRLKVGIGNNDGPTTDHVLGKFNPEERTDINRSVDHCVKALETWLSQGLEAAMNQANG